MNSEHPMLACPLSPLWEGGKEETKGGSEGREGVERKEGREGGREY